MELREAHSAPSLWLPWYNSCFTSTSESLLILTVNGRWDGTKTSTLLPGFQLANAKVKLGFNNRWSTIILDLVDYEKAFDGIEHLSLTPCIGGLESTSVSSKLLWFWRPPVHNSSRENNNNDEGLTIVYCKVQCCCGLWCPFQPRHHSSIWGFYSALN